MITKKATLPNGRRPTVLGTYAIGLLAVTISAGCHSAGGAESPPPSGECSKEWLSAPPVDPSIAIPSVSGRLVFHAAASGTQNYVCKQGAGDAGATFAWSLAGPDAVLSDCHSVAVGRHFASENGAPEWQMGDGTFVIAHKLAAKAATPGSVPWVLLAVDQHGGSGPLAEARYGQRIRTSGGVAPLTLCDASVIGTVVKVPYTADYVFYAP